MSGPDDVTVVWVEKAEGRDDALRAVADWARARGLKLAAARDGASNPASKIDFSSADRVEKELDRAREAVAALDADVAERALARADAILRDHPELPQAAWLRAEVHRGWAARWSRVEPRDDVRAQIASQDADALDGGRAAGIGEATFPPRPRSAVTFTVAGAGGRAPVTRLDGVELAGAVDGGVLAYPAEVAAGEHQLVVSFEGEIAFASWVSIAAAPGAARLSIPIHVGDDGACSGGALAGVTRDSGGVRAASVTCERWVAAAPAERRGAVLVARCERSACGPFLEWRSESSFGSGPAAEPPPPRHGGAWPAWATWTAVGVGAVAATTITLIATGVFESRPTEQRFVVGGVRRE